MNKSENKQEEPGGSSRLGKEAKIGVTVILLLLLVLGAVAAMRLTRSGGDDKLVAAADDRNDKKKEESGKAGKDEATAKGAGARFLAAGKEPTIVPAKPAWAKPLKTPDADRNPWKMASDRRETDRSGNSAPSLPPPFLPDAPDHPKPPRDNRYERYDRYASGSPDNRDADGAGPLRGADSEVRLIAPGEDPRPHSADTSVGRADPSGFAIAESSPAAPQFSREQPRYGYSAPPQPPSPSPEQPAYKRRELRNPPVFSHSSPTPRRDDGKYEVQPNDSYWTISEKLYNTGAYFKALAEHNRGKTANRDQLKPGELILAPAVTQLEQSYPDLCPKPSRRETLQNQNRASTVGTRNQYRNGRNYTVAEGDTLFNIARYELGKASRWVEIYELNRDVLGKDFNYLTPGTQLALPESEKPDSLTRRPGNGYQR
jgi:nucleoid-associated protein YgaU